MTPRRRQGTGRAAVDHVSAQLTNALSELSRVQVSQAAVAVANDAARLDALLGRLDLDALVAVTASAGLVHKAGQQQIAARRGKSPLLDDSTRCSHVLIPTPLVQCGLVVDHDGDHAGIGLHGQRIREERAATKPSEGTSP